VKFLSKVPSLESLNLEDNKLETLSGFPVLPNLTELILSNNFIFLLELSRDINELLPSLFVLDLSFNSLYDRAELIPLNQITSLHELSLENNPCSENPDIIQVLSRDYPNISIINNVQIKE
jgi:Leucine-rich repeat (LRR) protein